MLHSLSYIKEIHTWYENHAKCIKKEKKKDTSIASIAIVKWEFNVEERNKTWTFFVDAFKQNSEKLMIEIMILINTLNNNDYMELNIKMQNDFFVN